MTTIRRGIVLAVLGLLATAVGARADSPGDVSLTAGPEGATVQPDGSAIRTLYGANVPASARPFVNVVTTYSPPPKKR